MAAARSWPTSSSWVCCCASRTRRPARAVLDDLRANVRRTAVVLLAGFGIIALGLGYWQVWRGADLGQDPSNPRIADERLAQPRGRILDRNDQLLADIQGDKRHY